MLKTKACLDIQQVVFVAQPHLGLRHLITQHLELPMVGLIVVKITSTISKTSYKDVRILHWMPIMVFVP
jgi:hypothetical protein